ncbi:murinoglobulin-2-like [Penaeus indicus]|uniref:murinoglobulin-2-like n=1 Tax=Penaeus indicus TaxID=29960 RepID=UPI00300C0CCF
MCTHGGVLKIGHRVLQWRANSFGDSVSPRASLRDALPADNKVDFCEKELCNRLFVPVTLHKQGLIKVNGTLGGQKVHYLKPILFATGTRKTFIQTDKYIYKPGQNVQFRILTVAGPFLKISTETYPLIWVETPSSSRIAQWTNVENSAGLIHQTFKLADEPEEGTYRIKVQAKDGGPSTTKEFKVEEYVLPRFEVTVVPPKYILRTDTEFTFTVCAKYTFGQPVKGNVTLVIENDGWRFTRKKHTVTSELSGCKEIKVLVDDIGDSEYSAVRLSLTATVTEDGTGEEYNSEAVADIHRRALEFLYIGKEKYIKPNLPFTGKVKAVFPDKTPAANEPMNVCISGQCRNMSTSSKGILKYVIPKYSGSSVEIKAINYPEVKGSSMWRSKMYESRYSHQLKKYYSPSNSSLVIRVPRNRLPCEVSGHDHDIPVLFAAVNQTRATFTVQVVSRGQIQYSSSAEYELSSGNLPINEDHLVEPLPPPPEHTVIGVINIPIKLPHTASPSAKVVVWYTRPDGEIVSDTQIFDIEKCLDNDVNLVWSAARVQPGEQATLDLSAAPQSICSLGVVDKSVELLSSENDHLTLKKVFDIVENAMVKDWELKQANDYEYCRKMPEDSISRRSVRRRYPNDYVNALKMFDVIMVTRNRMLSMEIVSSLELALHGSQPLHSTLVFLGVVDKSVELLSSENDHLTLKKVFDIVENAMVKDWELKQANDYDYCRKMPEDSISRRSVRRRYPNDYVNALKMFDVSKLLLHTLNVGIICSSVQFLNLICVGVFISLVCLVSILVRQGSQTRGPQAKCGPRGDNLWPVLILKINPNMARLCEKKSCQVSSSKTPGNQVIRLSQPYLDSASSGPRIYTSH